MEIDLARNAEVALRMVREAPELTFDTETSGLDWRKNVPVGFVFTVDEESVYVPVRHGGGGNLPDPNGLCRPLTEAAPEVWCVHEFERQLSRAFAERVGPVIGHHLKFDVHAARTAGVDIGRNLICTQNNQCLIDEYSKGFSLEALCGYYKVQAKKSSEMYEYLGKWFGKPASRNLMGRYWELPGNDPVAYDYAVGDGISTQAVWRKQRLEIEDQKLATIWGVECSLIRVLADMEYRGVNIDLDYAQKLVGYIDDQVAQCNAKLPDGFNPKSPVQMRALMEEHGHTDWPLTEPSKRFPNGSPSFTKKWLQSHGIGKLIVASREWSNLKSSFVLPLIETHTVNGMVNATLKQNAADDGGTISGRLSCADPNLTAVPKHNKPLAARLRRCFVAPEGMEIYEADYQQAEPRTYAHYSNDATLMAGYNATPPKDVHTLVAEMMGVDRATTGKRMNMGMFTGMQIKTFSEHMELPLSEAADLWHRWNQTFPGIKPFQDKAKAVMLSRGYVRTILGRRGRLEAPRFAYKGVSKIIQGGNADMLKYKLVEMDRFLRGGGHSEYCWLFMSIHDAILWVAEASERGRSVSAKLQSIMTDVQSEPFNMRVPFGVDMEHGANWADASIKGGKQYYEEVERFNANI